MRKICNVSMVKKWINRYSASDEAKTFEVTRGIRGVITGMMNKAVKERITDSTFSVDALRRITLYFLFGDLDKPIQELSTHELSPAQWYALNRWVAPEKVDDVWISRPEFPHEMEQVARYAIRYYQLTAQKAVEQPDKITALAELFGIMPLPEPEMIEPVTAPLAQVVSELFKI